jgi:hypothetical protein
VQGQSEAERGGGGEAELHGNRWVNANPPAPEPPPAESVPPVKEPGVFLGLQNGGGGETDERPGEACWGGGRVSR